MRYSTSFLIRWIKSKINKNYPFFLIKLVNLIFFNIFNFLKNILIKICNLYNCVIRVKYISVCWTSQIVSKYIDCYVISEVNISILNPHPNPLYSRLSRLPTLFKTNIFEESLKERKYHENEKRNVGGKVDNTFFRAKKTLYPYLALTSPSINNTKNILIF